MACLTGHPFVVHLPCSEHKFRDILQWIHQQYLLSPVFGHGHVSSVFTCEKCAQLALSVIKSFLLLVLFSVVQVLLQGQALVFSTACLLAYTLLAYTLLARVFIRSLHRQRVTVQ